MPDKREQIQNHIRKSVRNYLSLLPQSERDGEIAAAMCTGMVLLCDWIETVNQHGFSNSEMREMIEEVGGEYGYELHDGLND